MLFPAEASGTWTKRESARPRALGLMIRDANPEYHSEERAETGRTIGMGRMGKCRYALFFPFSHSALWPDSRQKLMREQASA